MNTTGTALWLSGLALGLCFTAQAAEPQSNTQEVTYAGIKVSVDRETGRLRTPTASESAQLDQALTGGQQTRFAPGMARTFSAPRDAAAARATVRNNARGGVAVKVPQDQMSSLVAHRDAGGQLVIDHADTTGATASEGLPHE